MESYSDTRPKDYISLDIEDASENLSSIDSESLLLVEKAAYSINRTRRWVSKERKRDIILSVSLFSLGSSLTALIAWLYFTFNINGFCFEKHFSHCVYQ